MEPHATALVVGVQEFENRTFRIKNGRCAIHVSQKCSFSPKKLHEYYRGIGCNITADICLIVFNGFIETETSKIENEEIVHKIDIDKQSKDAILAKTLFERNATAQGGPVFLTSQIIGEINITESRKVGEREFENYYDNPVLYSLEESIFCKGQLGQFNINTKE